MTADNTSVFVIDDLSLDPYAHGFGQSPDGRTFSFQVRHRTLHVEVYRADFETTVPDTSDVECVVDTSVADIDVSDERSVAAAVRDAVADAENTIHQERTAPVWSFLNWLTSGRDRRVLTHG
ncbi:hypothetical protein [Hoyosella rhizosphaerae]|uniref:Uncharacterized protein n=1 Tax=Hoyosella rhizosphaerae TaxID=1755582 RepID=A0A916XB04_9ACTN|nr:hypothetical protein [Hoyosella rhizosphaerae]GGC58393.1 hypothetical protein GCM10011410_08610 [Hoyosella rhizosphaerae]